MILGKVKGDLVTSFLFTVDLSLLIFPFSSGDSGGPLVCAISAKPYVYEQTGVVSFGDNCSLAGKPGYYTSVHYHREWIKSVTGC